MEAIDDDEYPGLCIRYGAATGGVEPDAERYPCDECGAKAVYGVEQLILCGLYHNASPPDGAEPRIDTDNVAQQDPVRI